MQREKNVVEQQAGKGDSRGSRDKRGMTCFVIGQAGDLDSLTLTGTDKAVVTFCLIP